MPAPTRREFLRHMGLSAAALPFVCNLPSLGFANSATRKQRIVLMFSPNGVIQPNFWPDEEGAEFTLKESLKPLEPFKDRTLILHGVNDKVHGDGDQHMRGIGCLLTGISCSPATSRAAATRRPAGRPACRSIRKPETSCRHSPRPARVSARWSSECSFPIVPTSGRAGSIPAPTSRSRRSTIRTRCLRSCTATRRTGTTSRVCWTAHSLTLYCCGTLIVYAAAIPLSRFGNGPVVVTILGLDACLLQFAIAWWLEWRKRGKGTEEQNGRGKMI